MYTYKRKVGNGMFEATEQDFKKVWATAAFLNDIPAKCSACGSEDVAPMYKTPKNYEYFGVKCKSCGAEQSFHVKREDGSFFVKWDDKFEKYNSGEQKSGGDKQEIGGAKEFEDDLPF